MSASWMTAISPSRCGIPARIAAPLPLFGWWTTTVSVRPIAHSSSSSAVPSVGPSSTTTIWWSIPSSSIRLRAYVSITGVP
jgi:hypothetical protein